MKNLMRLLIAVVFLFSGPAAFAVDGFPVIEGLQADSISSKMLELDHNTEQLSGNKVLVVTDLMIQFLDPAAASRNVTFPAEASSTDLVFIIVNAASNPDELLLIYSDAPFHLDTLGPGQSGIYTCNGTTWRGGNYKNIILDRIDSKVTLTTVRMSGTLKTDLGADVASANDMTLGTDGNSFDITGTTTINTIATKGVGTWVMLQFDDALQLTHSADLFLPTAGNITTVAGDIATFYEYASGDWRCESYTRADGTPLTTTGLFVLAGMSGGQVGYGGTDSGDDLVLGSTTHGTKGYVTLGHATNGLTVVESNSKFSIGYQSFPGDWNFHGDEADDNLSVINYGSRDVEGFVALRKSGNPVLGTVYETEDGEDLGSIRWFGVNTNDNWQEAFRIEVEQSSIATTTKIPAHMRIHRPNVNGLVIGDGTVGVNVSGGVFNGTLAVAYKADPHIALITDSTKDAIIGFYDGTTTREWDIGREEDDNTFRITENGVGTWMKIAPGGQVTFAGNLTVTKTLIGESFVSLDSDPTVTVTKASGFYVNDDDDAIEYDLPPDPTGWNVCFRNRYVQAITIDPDDSDFITMTDTAAAAGEAVVSAGAADEYMCLVGLDVSNWIGMEIVGTWVEESP